MDIVKGTAMTLGKFDGFHRGHQLLLKKIKDQGKANDLETAVFTFEIDEKRISHSKKKGLLNTEAERIQFIKNENIDHFIEYPMSDSFFHMEAETFIEDLLVDKYKVKYIAVGEDFRFGYQRRGNPAMLQEFGNHYGFKVDIVEKIRYKNNEISSSFIREELLKGNISDVNNMLGYTYSISGDVVHGRKIGSKIGFPTVNVNYDRVKLLPLKGVYISDVIMDGKKYNAITNIGSKPTVSDDEELITIESYILDEVLDAYYKNISVELNEFVRKEQKFNSLDELKAAIAKDVETARIYKNNNEYKKAARM